MGELLWQLVKLYGYAKVKDFVEQMGNNNAPGQPGDTRRLRVELVSGVPDSGFELLDRDNDVFVWDEPDGGDN